MDRHAYKPGQLLYSNVLVMSYPFITLFSSRSKTEDRHVDKRAILFRSFRHLGALRRVTFQLETSKPHLKHLPPDVPP